eukprot:292373_1
MLSQTFQDAQSKWMEDMLSNKNNICDTIFIIGPEKKKMYGLRALLANISPVFKAQLYGNFKESSLNEEIEYPTISAVVFECILRVSFGLNPLITEHTAVPLIEASHMLQIQPLQRECQYYLQHCINPENVLFLLNSAYCLSSLDLDLYGKCRKIILETTNSYSILSNEGFYSLHPELIIDIISTNDFKANEKVIWDACLKWAQNVIKKSLKFPKKNKNILKYLRSKLTSNIYYNDDGDDEKKFNDEDNDQNDDNDDIDDFDFNKNNYVYKRNNNEPLNIEYVLSPIIPYVRFPLMDKTFFIEHVGKYLNRQQSESVLIYFILNKPSVFNHEERKSFVTFNVVAANKEFESAKKLPDLNQDSLFCSQIIKNDKDYQWFIIDILFVGIVRKIEIKNRYSDKDTVKSFTLQVSENENEYDKDDSNWIDVQKFQSAKSSSWQMFNVDVDVNELENYKSRYWRIILLDTYGGYTCINHIKLTMQ